jgi:hypothetical protein
MINPGDSRAARQHLRHTVATLAYRGGKVLRGVPADFDSYRIGDSTRRPIQILAHIGDLLDWALALAQGQHTWKEAKPGNWDEQVARFFAGLDRLDAYLASDEPLGFTAEQLFQGPVADALTHVGQLALLRRLAGTPVRGENYLKANITAGCVGPTQPAPVREFD